MQGCNTAMAGNVRRSADRWRWQLAVKCSSGRRDCLGAPGAWRWKRIDPSRRRHSRSLRPSNKPFARVSQSVAGAALVKETAVQLVYKRLNVARYRRLFRAELLGCSRKWACPHDRQKVSATYSQLMCFNEQPALGNRDSTQPTSTGRLGRPSLFQRYFYARLLRARCRYEPDQDPARAWQFVIGAVCAIAAVAAIPMSACLRQTSSTAADRRTCRTHNAGTGCNDDGPA
jgi:hypothetical protein